MQLRLALLRFKIFPKEITRSATGILNNCQGWAYDLVARYVVFLINGCRWIYILACYACAKIIRDTRYLSLSKEKLFYLVQSCASISPYLRNWKFVNLTTSEDWSRYAVVFETKSLHLHFNSTYLLQYFPEGRLCNKHSITQKHDVRNVSRSSNPIKNVNCE